MTIGIVGDVLALQRSCTNYPLLPKLLPSLFEKLKLSSQQNQQAVAEIVKLYHLFCEGLTKQPEYNSFVPDIALDLALALCDLEEKSFAVEETKYSVAQWLDLHGVEPGKVFDQENEVDRQLLRSIIFQEDNAYLEKLQQVVEKIGTVTDKDFVQVQSLLEGWLNLKRWSTIPSMADMKEPEVQEKTEATPATEEKQESTESIDGLSTFSFETVTVDKEGEIIKCETKSAQYYTEILPGGVELEMVYIPSQTFDIDDDYKVNMPSFFMSKYPITQAQWRAVSSIPSQKAFMSLDSNPSYFIGDNLPVENISWRQAVEFCDRLSNISGKNYRLPSPVVWEYASKGGKSTKYYFGDNISKFVANMASSPFVNYIPLTENYPPKTTDVGQFPANPFGLYDMIGNVWEFCTFHWHVLDDVYCFKYVQRRKVERNYSEMIDFLRQSTLEDKAEIVECCDDNGLVYEAFNEYYKTMNIKKSDPEKDVLYGGSWANTFKDNFWYEGETYYCDGGNQNSSTPRDFKYSRFRPDLGFRIICTTPVVINSVSDLLDLYKKALPL